MVTCNLGFSILIFFCLKMQLWSWLRKQSPKLDIQKKLWLAWMWQHLNSIRRANTIWTSSHPMTQSLPSLLMNWLISTRALWRIIQVTSWHTHFYTSWKAKTLKAATRTWKKCCIESSSSWRLLNCPLNSPLFCIVIVTVKSVWF